MRSTQAEGESVQSGCETDVRGGRESKREGWWRTKGVGDERWGGKGIGVRWCAVEKVECTPKNDDDDAATGATRRRGARVGRGATLCRSSPSLRAATPLVAFGGRSGRTVRPKCTRGTTAREKIHCAVWRAGGAGAEGAVHDWANRGGHAVARRGDEGEYNVEQKYPGVARIDYGDAHRCYSS